MAGHELIDAQVEALGQRLPAAVVDELADGLVTCWEAHVGAGQAPTTAARTALAEFGDPDAVVSAFVGQSRGRRMATWLLLSGPVAGALWATALLIAAAWTWPQARVVAPVLGVTLAGTVLLLVAAARSDDYRRTQRFAAVGGLGTVLLDAALIATVLTLDPPAGIALAVAALASLTRLTLTVRHLPTLVRVGRL